MTTEFLEPRGSAICSDDDRFVEDGERASLVRWWMVAGGGAQQRTWRDHTHLSLAPAPVETPAPAPVAMDADYCHDLIGFGEPRTHSLAVEPELAAPVPLLPHQRGGTQIEQATRIAVLMDVGSVSNEVAAGLLAHLDGRGSLDVCRAYADEDDQRGTMALDAVHIARDSSVDEVVLAGDLTRMLPLVRSLHAAGVRVVGVGAAHTPHDVRAACHEFIDTASFGGSVVVIEGRHRA